MKAIIHHLTCYASIMGLGFMFACLIVGAVEYLFSLAVIMTGLACIAVVTSSDKSGGYHG